NKNLFCLSYRILQIEVECINKGRRESDIVMNTTAVAEMLGVSASTVQRWVKHLGLEMQRNEYGHYVYSEEDIEKLKKFQQELHKGGTAPKSAVKKKERKGTAVLN